MTVRLCLAVVAFATLTPTSSEAGLIYYNNFNLGSTTGTSAANAALLFTTTSGSGVMSSNFAISNIVSFTGTTNNALNGDPAGAGLALQDGTGNVNAGGYLQIASGTIGNSNIVVSFAIQATATGFQSDQFQYTIDGTNYNNFGSPFTPVSSTIGYGNAAGLQTFDLSSITGLNNDANAGFRIVFNLGTGIAGSSSGNNRLDNIQINGTSLISNVVPEPSSFVLTAIALLGAAGLVRFRRKQVA